MNIRHNIKAKAVYINNVNTGRTARTWDEVRIAVLNFASDLFPSNNASEPLSTLLGAFNIPPVRFDLTGENSVETPRSFTVTLEKRPAEGVPFSHGGAAAPKNPKKEGAPF